jgi:hypothetical protein
MVIGWSITYRFPMPKVVAYASEVVDPALDSLIRLTLSSFVVSRGRQLSRITQLILCRSIVISLPSSVSPVSSVVCEKCERESIPCRDAVYTNTDLGCTASGRGITTYKTPIYCIATCFEILNAIEQGRTYAQQS